MGYKALYRTYRPTSFDEIVGQKYIVQTLVNAVHQNKMAHAYLFCGPRGTGKTSIAKLLAKAVNCEDQKNAPCNKCHNCKSSDSGTHPDIIEIDAASNNGVDQIRDLIEKVKYSPIEGRFKVYIIDEVHMLSAGAFNALLKTLEEPPAHVIFILATTEPHKVLPTIISRCQRYDFSKVSDEDIINRMKTVLKIENINVDDDALSLVATLADGGMRDALSILDQCIAYSQNNITSKDVNDIYGITTTEEKIDMINMVFAKDSKNLLVLIQNYVEKGIDIRRLTNDLIEILKECVEYTYTQDAALLSYLTKGEVEKLMVGKLAKTCLKMIDILMETTEQYRTASNASAYFEVAILKMITEVDQESVPVIQKATAPKMIEKDEVTPIETKVEVNVEEDKPQSKIEKIKTINKEKMEKKPEVISTLDDEKILSLLVAANKDVKVDDAKTFQKLDSFMQDITTAKYASLLKLTQIIASGKDFVLLGAPNKSTANQINELTSNQDLYYFIKDNLQMDKMIFAITNGEVQRITQLFLEGRKNNTLPKPTKINKYNQVEKEEVRPETIEDKLFNLFGKDNVEIVEEDK